MRMDFPGPGLAGQEGQPGAELQLDAVDERDVLYFQ